MNSINTLGIRIVGITLILALAAFGVWKGIELGIAQYQASKSAKIAVSPTLVPSPYVAPLATITPDPKQLTAITEAANKTLVGYTKTYIESLPIDTPKDQVLDPTKVEAFVNANKGKLLPDLPIGTVQTTTKSGKEAMQLYLDAISPIQNPAISGVTGDTITSALTKQQSGEELQALAPVLTLLEKNFTVFQSVKAPTEAVSAHTKLLQATQALINNVKLLQEMRNDIVGGLIGQKNLSDLNSVFADIEKQILALETKYGIK